MTGNIVLFILACQMPFLGKSPKLVIIGGGIIFALYHILDSRFHEGIADKL